MSRVFISDLHLDSDKPELFDAFERFVERELSGPDTIQGLYILGDLCEVWVGDDDDSEFVQRLRKLLSALSSRVPLYFLPGNRDFLLGSEYARSCGMQLLEDPSYLELDGKKIILTHGDAYCTRDKEYQQMRKLFRSDNFREQILAQTLDERRKLAAALRNESQRKNANKADNIMDVTATEISAVFSACKAEFMVHGHTHRPGIHPEKLENKMRYRYVLGDWARCGWVLRYNEGEFRMECFRCEY